MEIKTAKFDITAVITRPDYKIDNSSDKEIVNKLNDERSLIQGEIEEEIRNKIGNLIKNQDVFAEISFENGSILGHGMVIIHYLADIGGAIAFFDYISKPIKRIVERSIRNRLPYNSDFDIAVRVSPNRLVSKTHYKSNKFDIFKISHSQLLISITLINIMLFIGGTLFNVIEVPSILKKYEEANAKFLEAKDKMDFADQTLKSATIKYQLDQQSIENAKYKVFQKRDEIIGALSSDTIKIKSRISNIDAKAASLENEVGLLKNNISDNELLLKKINTDISKLQENNIKFGFTDLWIFMNLWLKIIVSCLISVSIITIVVFIVRIFI